MNETQEIQSRQTESSTGPQLDLKSLADLGRQTVDAMHSLREVLEARAQALEDVRAALAEQHQHVTERADAVERRRVELSTTVADREAGVEKRAAEIEIEQARLATLAEELAQREAGINDQLAEIDQMRQDLAHHETELNGRQAEVENQQKAITQHNENHERREAELTAMLERLQQKAERLEKQEADLIEMQKQWDQKVSVLHGAQADLSRLQEELRQELARAADGKNELLPVFNLKPAGGGDASGASEQSSDAERKAFASLQRYQKLCRDAKRRAIGH